MSTIMTRGAIAAACLLLLTAAHADDNDVDVFGPSGRDSLALFDSASSFRADELRRDDGSTLGHTASHDNAVVLQGVYSPLADVSIVGALRQHDSNNATTVFPLVTESIDRTGLGDSLFASAWVRRPATGAGFALAASAGVLRDPGAAAQFWSQLQPQLRFSPTLLLGAVVGVRDLPGFGGGNPYLSMNLAWRALPALSLVPSVALYHYGARNTYGSFDDRALGLSATYHLDGHWALSAEARWTSQTDRKTDFYANDIANGRGVAGDIGARYSF